MTQEIGFVLDYRCTNDSIVPRVEVRADNGDRLFVDNADGRWKCLVVCQCLLSRTIIQWSLCANNGHAPSSME